MKIMTLEDFFTLAEMNNGLMVPSRVGELVTVMMNDTGCYAKNVGEATRQWSALSRAIAATENKDCLNLFIQLDGLQFIYKWLKDAQKYSNEASDSFVEESITHLLQVLEKLHDDNEKMFSSEIWTVVNDLRSHNSLKVQDKARVLFESWEEKRTGEDKKTSGDSVSDVETNGDLIANGMGKCVNIVTKDALECFLSDTLSSDKAPAEERVSETTTCMDDLRPGPVESEPNSDMLLDPQLTDDRPLDHIGSPSISHPIVEPPVHPPKSATSAAVPCADVSGNCRELELISDVKDITKIGSSPWKLELPKEPKLLEEIPFPSSLDAADAMNSSTEPTSLSVSGDKNLCGEGSTWIDQKASDFDGKVAMSNGHSNRRQSSSAFDSKEGGEFNHHVLWSSSGGKKYQENLKDERTVMLPNEDDGKINARHDLSIRDYVMATDYGILKKNKDREHEPSGKKSNLNLDYGLLDPLEFARQVAIEVEREVVDYREQSCSSEKLPGENVQPSCSLDSVSGYRSHASGGSSEAAIDLDLSAEASAGQEESSANSKDTNVEPTEGIQDVEISQVTEASQEETNKEKGVCNFDLNVEVFSEDTDRPMHQFSAPVSVVSASRPVAAPGLPMAPLQFGGNLGWKGSASTSAFRPASSRRMPDIHKDLSNGGRSIIISKHRQELVDIDLNLPESGDGRTRDLAADKQILASLSLPSRESCVKMRSRSEHIALDLNLASEGGGGPTDWRASQLFPQRYFQPSLSNSSTSSIKQPSLKNIDLNDHPSFTNDSFDHSHLSKYTQNLNFPGSVKSDDSAISILGTRVEVNHKEFAFQTQPVLNGKTSEFAFDINSGRTGSFLGMGSVLPYVHPTFYGYSNIAPAPAPAHGLPFSSTIYGPGGPIPYMVDSKGAPVIPQIVGSASALPTAFSQPPFFLNTTHSSLSYSVGSSLSMLDLNSRTMMEGGNKETSLGLFLNSDPARPMDEQLWSTSQPTISSGFGGKRKEPENGWEHYPPKPHTPPWI